MPADIAAATGKDRVLSNMERLALAHEARRQMPPAQRKPNKRRAREPFDKRSVLGRRVMALVDIFRAKLGPDADDPVTAAAITRCAETVALSEDLRARMLRGEALSADDVLRASRTADLLTRRLHLDRHHKPQPSRPPSPSPSPSPTPSPSLADYLATREGGA